jgi:hypothetical protein
VARRHLLSALAALVPLSLPVAAQTGRAYGTPQEARWMLERAIQALRTDEAKALQLFIEGGEGFRQKDLYPFCGGSDGMFSAHPELMGLSMRNMQSKRGPGLGEKLYEIAKEGEIAEVTYYWTRPGSTEILQKVALVTRVGDQVCAVGYYRPVRRGKEAVP